MKKVFSKFIMELIAVIFITALVSEVILKILQSLSLLLPENCWIEVLGLVTFVYLLFFIGWKVSLLYKLSFSQYLVLISIVELYLIIGCFNESQIKFQEFSHIPFLSGLAWIDLFIWLPLSALFLGGGFEIFGLIVIAFEKIFSKENKVEDKSIYVCDDLFTPVKPSEQAKKVKELILNGNFSDSFSIGVLGAWGYGKSSFLGELKSLFKNNNKVVQVYFSPYLNHNEDDVVGEFFNALKSQIQPYSGALSRSISNYAANVTKAYSKGDFKELIDSRFSSYSQSAVGLYEQVEKMIELLDRKIIIYIDDLDRLSAREIIQVFKLIRNTSKFPKTFFIVSLDKNMVLNELTTTIPNSRKYIDKFFQLEINLPKIDGSVLRNEFLTLLDRLKKLIPNYKETKEKIEKTLKTSSEAKREVDKKCLFDLYINNYRDVKKLYNQVANDVSNEPEGLDNFEINDYINFALLRLKFPEIYEIILTNPLKILTSERYNPKGIGVNTEDMDGIDKIIASTTEVYYYFKGKRLKNYEKIVNDTKDQEETDVKLNDDEVKLSRLITIRKETEYSNNDFELLMQTLEEIFKKGHPVTRSIRRAKQLDAFLKMQFTADQLFHSEFVQLLTTNTSTSEGEKYFLSLVKQNKWNQIVSKIFEHKLLSKQETLNLSRIILYSYINETSLNLIKGDKLNMLSKLLDTSNNIKLFHKSTLTMLDDKEKVSIIEEYFCSAKVSFLEKFELIQFITDLQKFTQFWGYTREQLSDKAIEFFKSFLAIYLEKINKNAPSSDLKTAYYDLKDLLGSEMNSHILEVAKETNFESLLVESIQPINDLRSDKIGCSYIIDSKIQQMLPYILDFIEYLRIVNIPKLKNEINEYLEFIELSELIRNKPLKFEFNYLKVPKEEYFTKEVIRDNHKRLQLIFSFSKEIEQVEHGELHYLDYVMNSFPISKTDNSRIIVLDIEVNKISHDECAKNIFLRIEELIKEKYPSLDFELPKVFNEKGVAISTDDSDLVKLIHTA